MSAPPTPPAAIPVPYPEFIGPRYEFPDHQRLEHRDIKASIDREGCHTRSDVGDLSAKVGEGLLATTSNVKDQLADSYCKLQGSIHRTGEYVGDKVDRTNLYLGDKVESNKTDLKDNQDRYYIGGQAASEVRAKALLDAIKHQSEVTVDGLNENRTETAMSRERLQEELARYNTTNVSAHQNTIYELTKDVCDVRRDIATGFGASSLEHCRDTGALSKQMSEGFAATQLEAAKNFAAIQLEAKQNKFELAQAMAECCCDIKERIATSAAATQQLIRENETSRLRDSLASANSENLFLRFAQGGGGGGHGQSSRCWWGDTTDTKSPSPSPSPRRTSSSNSDDIIININPQVKFECGDATTTGTLHTTIGSSGGESESELELNGISLGGSKSAKLLAKELQNLTKI